MGLAFFASLNPGPDKTLFNFSVEAMMLDDLLMTWTSYFSLI
jgi:hypothetical protein